MELLHAKEHTIRYGCPVGMRVGKDGEGRTTVQEEVEGNETMGDGRGCVAATECVGDILHTI